MASKHTPGLQKARTFVPSLERELLQFDMGLSSPELQVISPPKNSGGVKRKTPELVDLCSQSQAQENCDDIFNMKTRRPGDVKAKMREKALESLKPKNLGKRLTKAPSKAG